MILKMLEVDKSKVVAGFRPKEEGEPPSSVSCGYIARFCDLDTTDVWGWMLVLGDCPGHCKKLSSISDLYPVEASSNPPITSFDNPKCLQIL